MSFEIKMILIYTIIFVIIGLFIWLYITTKNKKEEEKINRDIDFSNDNEYGGEIRSKEDIEEALEQLEKYTLKWTSQSLTQKIFTFFRVKINADEESKFNWYY